MWIHCGVLCNECETMTLNFNCVVLTTCPLSHLLLALSLSLSLSLSSCSQTQRQRCIGGSKIICLLFMKCYFMSYITHNVSEDIYAMAESTMRLLIYWCMYVGPWVGQCVMAHVCLVELFSLVYITLLSSFYSLSHFFFVHFALPTLRAAKHCFIVFKTCHKCPFWHNYADFLWV